jgi:glutamyl-tRNA reductase
VLDDLVVIHDQTGTEDFLPPALNSLRWQTCLRQIVLLNRAENRSLIASARADSEIHQGKDAYRFLLEVVCGLRSPLIAETEVLGQFRDFCAKTNFPQTSWGCFLRQITSDLMVDAKRVRHRHLEGLGCQSYGSLVRHHLKGFPSVALIGVGQLASEIVPWLVSKAELTLFCRNPLRAQAFVKDYPQVRLEQFKMADAGDANGETALVIAAPLASHEIENWVELQRTTFTRAIDLRAEAALDKLQVSFPVLTLPELFAAAKDDRHRLASRLAAAQAEIDLAVDRQEQQARFRPLGWEDLCA